jgi:hypothetical protein
MAPWSGKLDPPGEIWLRSPASAPGFLGAGQGAHRDSPPSSAPILCRRSIQYATSRSVIPGGGCTPCKDVPHHGAALRFQPLPEAIRHAYVLCQAPWATTGRAHSSTADACRKMTCMYSDASGLIEFLGYTPEKPRAKLSMLAAFHFLRRREI